MGTPTANYSFTKPAVGGDTDDWGNLLNANWELVDSLLSGGTQVDGIDIINGTGAFGTLSATTFTVTDVTATGTVDGVHVDADKITSRGGFIEASHNLTGLTPAIKALGLGTYATWTLTGGAAHTPTVPISAGESVTLLVWATGGATVTWPAGIQWFNGEPVLEADTWNLIEFFRVGGTFFGAYVGSVS